jgi:hypothetical protein
MSSGYSATIAAWLVSLTSLVGSDQRGADPTAAPWPPPTAVDALGAQAKANPGQDHTAPLLGDSFATSLLTLT